MNLYGIPTTQYEAQGKCGSDSTGATDEDLIKGVRRYGFKPLYHEYHSKKDSLKAFKWVRQQTNSSHFVMAFINGFGPRSHWILILRILTNETLLIWDPSDHNPKTIARSELFEAWWNYPVTEKDFDLEQICLVGMAPQTRIARRAVEIQCHLLHPKMGSLPHERE